MNLDSVPQHDNHNHLHVLVDTGGLVVADGHLVVDNDNLVAVGVDTLVVPLCENHKHLDVLVDTGGLVDVGDHVGLGNHNLDPVEIPLVDVAVLVFHLVLDNH